MEILPPDKSLTATPMQASLGFMTGADGQERMAWAKYGVASASWGTGYAWGGGFGYGGQGAIVSREGVIAGAVANDLRLSNPTLATIVESLKTNAVHVGLTFSSKLDPAALDITPDVARDLAKEIDRRFKAWAANPVEVDLSGRFNLHALAGTVFESYLLTGEVVATLDWQTCFGARTQTKISLLENNQLDRTMNEVTPSGAATMGVQFDKVGRIRGYWLRRWVPGQMSAPISEYVDARMPWGRPRVVHIFEQLVPNQVRGVSPLTPALTPAQERNMLQEYTLASAMVHASFAMTVESDLPSHVALNGVDPTSNYSIAEMTAARADWYTNVRIEPRPGTINHMSPGDRLRIHKSETPNATYQAFESALDRSAARTAGAMVEDVTGNYEKVNFSASRMATELPYRTTVRRRSLILEPFYKAALRCWLEEEVETGRLPLPPGAKPFYEAADAYCAGKWLGIGRLNPDPKKSAEGDILEVENNLSTLSDKLAERGLDLEEVIAQRMHENSLLRAAGLDKATLLGNVTTMTRREEQLDDPDAEPSPQPAPAPAPAPTQSKRRKATS